MASGDQQAIAREIGAPAASALLAFGERRYAEAGRLLSSLRPVLRRIGGSNAQRDLFERMLIEAYVRDGDHRRSSILLSERLVVRGADRFAADRLARPVVGDYLEGERLSS
jgi:hypothetical protein